MTHKSSLKPGVVAQGGFHVMVKPAGARCNLACSYCFYLEKEGMYSGSLRMDDAKLEAYVREHCAAHPGDVITFAWQGGEPTLMGLPFFERAVALQQQYAGGRRVENAIQTNGTLLDDDWGRFFRQHRFLVGISIDGPRELHDAFRFSRGGRPSFDRVMAGLAVLQRHNVQFNTLTCVHARNARRPLDVYRFLKEAGSRHMQFIPIVERIPSDAERARGLERAGPPRPNEVNSTEIFPWTVKPEDYGYFLVSLYDRWVRNDVGKIYIQHIESALGSWLGAGAGICVFNPTCGRAMAMEHDGSVYACDHYVYPEYRLGCIGENPLVEMVDSPQMEAFGQAKRESLPKQCRECPVLFACWGGCPKHRFATTADGEPGLNYLCPAYQQFFQHIDADMRVMAAQHRRGQPVAPIRN